jgi:hypothetical protein
MLGFIIGEVGAGKSAPSRDNEGKDSADRSSWLVLSVPKSMI